MIVTASVLYKSDKRVTIITKGSGLSDAFYKEYELFIKDNWKQLITTRVTVPIEVANELTLGVEVLNGDIDVNDYINQTTFYKWVRVRQKDITNSIGEDKLSGSIGYFEKQ